MFLCFYFYLNISKPNCKMVIQNSNSNSNSNRALNSVIVIATAESRSTNNKAQISDPRSQTTSG